MDKSPYFYYEDKIEITEVAKLLEINKPKTYGQPGIEFKIQSVKDRVYTQYDYPYKTSGLFRGQVKDWPLKPSAYRKTKINTRTEVKLLDMIYLYNKENRKLNDFSKIAQHQNYDFPKNKIDQMIIAQHYGIKTPLLDWTTNIFVAIYFALNIIENSKDKDSPYIYHIKDERLLAAEIDEKKIEIFDKSCFLRPSPIDRRIERQFSVFTFHPLPISSVAKIPVTEYKISKTILMDLWRFMEGIGFTSFHYFPDYAGIIQKLTDGYML